MANEVVQALSGFGSGVGNSLYYIAIVALLAIFLGVTAFLAINSKKWNWRVIILEEGADKATLIHFTKGTINKRKGEFLLKGKEYRKSRPPVPTAENTHITNKGAKVVILKRIGSGDFDYVPLSLMLRGLDITIKPFPQETINWIGYELAENDKLYGDWWDKWGNAVMYMATGFIFLAGLIIVLKMNSDIMEGLKNIASQITGALKNSCSANVVKPAPPGG